MNRKKFPGISGVDGKKATLVLCRSPGNKIRMIVHPASTGFLMKVDKAKILKHFTERRLKPLTLLASDKDKIKKFAEMRELLNSFR